MAKKSKKNRKAKLRLAKLSLAAILLAAIVCGSVAFGVYVFWHQYIEAGQFKLSDTFLGENLRDSLDLKVAAKASYPSGPVELSHKLGDENGVSSYHFSFLVKADGLKESGLLTLPTTPRPPDGYPVLILIHGFSSPRDYNTDIYYRDDMNFYSQHGFAVFKPDLRGVGLSIKDGHPDSAYYSMAYNTDVLSLVTALKQSPGFDKSNISVWGHSMGAYIGLRAAVISPDIKNVIMLSGPLGSLTKMYATYIPPSDAHDSYALATRNDVFSKYHTPNHDQFWYDSSPINLVGQIKANLQIHVGLDDKTVPPEFSADLDKALTQAGIVHQYFQYPAGEHSLVLQRDLIWGRSLELLNKSP